MRLSVLIVLGLAGIWCLVIGEISLPQILLGLLSGSLIVLVTNAGRGHVIPLSQLPRRLFYLGVYLLVLVPYDVVLSNLDLARRLLRPRPAIQPGIVRLRVDAASEVAVALRAHGITLSPGDLVVDFSEDGRTLYVHLVDVTELEKKQATVWRFYERVLEGILT